MMHLHVTPKDIFDPIAKVNTGVKDDVLADKMLAPLAAPVTSTGALQFEAGDPLTEDAAVKTAVDKLKRRKQMSFDEIVRKEGVKQSIYLEYIKTEIETEAACLELPLTMVILMCFTVLAISMLHQEQMFAMEEAYEFDIVENANFAFSGYFGHKTIYDVNSIADFWSWVRVGFLGLVVQPAWGYSEPLPDALGGPITAGHPYDVSNLPQGWQFVGYEDTAPFKNDYLRYTKLIAGVRLRQKVAPAESELCVFPTVLDKDAILRWLAKPCMPSSLGVFTPEMQEAEVFTELDRVEYLFPDLDDIDELRRKLIDMEDGCTRALAVEGNLESCRCDWCKVQTPVQPWLDWQTARIEVSMLIYNPTYGAYTYVSINFFFNRGGCIHKFVHCMSCFADPLQRPMSELVITGVCIFVWLSIYMVVLTSELKEVCSIVCSAKAKFLKALYEDYLGFWNVVDWISIFIGTQLVFYWFSARMLISGVNEMLPNQIDRSLNPPDRAQYEAESQKLFDAVENMSLGNKDFTIFMIIYPFIIMLRLFKSFEAQPRLAIVTATLKTAAPDLAHFFMVFFCVFVCFLVNSILFFGQDVEDFSTVDRATFTCFRAMFGDWDWAAMREIGYTKAAVWFWLFMLVMVLVLLNMLLAIIMDAYQVEKEKASDATTLMRQIMDMVRRRRQFKRGERVRLNDVWAVFCSRSHGDEKAMMASEEKIKAELLVSIVPRMPFKQAHRTLVNSLSRWDRLSKGYPSFEDTINEVEETLITLERRVGLVKDDVMYAAEQLDFFDRVTVPDDYEHDFYFGEDGKTAEHATSLWLHRSVSAVSAGLSTMFEKGLETIKLWQDDFECDQTDLHATLGDMARTVKNQTEVIAKLKEFVTNLHDPHEEMPMNVLSGSSPGLPNTS
eukprot:TRINITY_DN28942_c0_g1_i1.p1 TRINITY_DN28942_c0_g1~~TRINITY_DN28942_c0_g1_i1.p1  ORF type:complete len:906 (-),score=135.37 TRINITY_DN28942_c0_g1_i1:91-2778(-)